MKKHAIFLGLISIVCSSANASELGRLFYTPQQRLQLEAQQAGTASEDGSGKRNYIMVNGVIQKNGGKRMVWINGTQQPTTNDNGKAPSIVTVTVPGKSQPVQAKVGQRLTLDNTVPEEK